jgi:hypothetical protein
VLDLDGKDPDRYIEVTVGAAGRDLPLRLRQL